jgi:flagellar biogenesis protein FliO
MPKILFLYAYPRNLSFALGLVLGVCVFQSCFSSKAYALDSDSQIFEQNQNVNSSEVKKSQPLALPEETPNPSPSLFVTLVRLLVALIVIIGLIVLTVWGLKLVLEKKGWNQFTEEGKPLKVLTSTYIAPRKAIYLIEVGNRILVVGVGSEEMNCLDVIQDTEEVNALRGAALQGFPKIFSRISQRQETANREAETKEIIKESNQVVGEYLNKLKKMKKNKPTSDSNDGES